MRVLPLILLLALIPLTTGNTQPQAGKPGPSSDRKALEILLTVVERNIESAAEAMPADKYSFAPVPDSTGCAPSARR